MDISNGNVNLQIQEKEHASEELNFFQNIIGVVLYPQRAMKFLCEKPKVLVPFFLIALSMLVYYLFRLPIYRVYIMRIFQSNVEYFKSSFTQQDTDHILNAIIRAKLILTPIIQLAWWLIWSGVLWGLVRMFKGKGKFKQFLSITGYTYVINLLYLIVSLIISFYSGKLMLDTSLTNLVGSNMEGSYLYGVIRGIDLFGIWRYILIGVGTAYISKLSGRKVWVVTSILFVLTVLIGASSAKYM